jgi:hypothetical protein
LPLTCNSWKPPSPGIFPGKATRKAAALRINDVLHIVLVGRFARRRERQVKGLVDPYQCFHGDCVAVVSPVSSRIRMAVGGSRSGALRGLRPPASLFRLFRHRPAIEQPTDQP